MNDDEIRVLKIDPGKAPYIAVLPNTLDALQAAVGGLIEIVYLGSNLVLICNEEGKLMGLPVNRRLGNDIIVGTFLIAGVKGYDFCSLSDADIIYCANCFAQPLRFFGGPDNPTKWWFS